MEVGQNGLKNQILIYRCDICEQDFNRIQNLRSHFNATHSKSPNKNSLKGASINYVAVFFQNFDPPSPPSSLT